VTDTPGVRRAWGWVAHLQEGGTTPWRAWAVEGRPGGRFLPGAQQLELLRRLNEVGPPSPELATRVLEASAPGRGRPDLELDGAVDRLAFGPPPVDPADLPDDELIRVAAGLVAEDVVAAGLPEPAREPVPRWWRTRYRLVGDAELADPRRAELIRRGRPPGGRGAVVLVLGTDLGQLLVDAWTTRCLTEGVAPWRDWIDAWARRTTLPPRADLLQAASRWRETAGAGRVRVVLDMDELPRLVGVRRPLSASRPLSADATELARRIGPVLNLLVVPEARQALVEHHLRPWLAAAGGEPLVLPPEHRRWARARATAMRDDLLRGRYPVHGDPDSLLRVARAAGVDRPADAGVLALAMRLLLEKGD
jgi:hypothetical protein